MNLTSLFKRLSIFAVPRGTLWISQMNKSLSEYHLWGIIWWCPWCLYQQRFPHFIQHRPRSPHESKRIIWYIFPFPRGYKTVSHYTWQTGYTSCMVRGMLIRKRKVDLFLHPRDFRLAGSLWWEFEDDDGKTTVARAAEVCPSWKALFLRQLSNWCPHCSFSLSFASHFQ